MWSWQQLRHEIVCCSTTVAAHESPPHLPTYSTPSIKVICSARSTTAALHRQLRRIRMRGTYCDDTPPAISIEKTQVLGSCSLRGSCCVATSRVNRRTDPRFALGRLVALSGGVRLKLSADVLTSQGAQGVSSLLERPTDRTFDHRV
nr:hypothetical protein CFP56_53217 [Quercus suber]